MLDMFEPQDHPERHSRIPARRRHRPTTTPGWTLAFQMGVQFDRVLEPFTGPFEKVTDWNVKPPAGRVTAAGATRLSSSAAQVNDAATAVNRLLRRGR